jgi:hypothetical protein
VLPARAWRTFLRDVAVSSGWTLASVRISADGCLAVIPPLGAPNGRTRKPVFVVEKGPGGLSWVDIVQGARIYLYMAN